MAGPEPRTSIWSIPESRRTLYFGLFTVLTLAGTGWTLWYEIAYQTRADWAETVQGIIRGIPAVGAFAAITTVTLIEARRLIMVVGDWLEQKIRKNREKDIEKARQEALEEAQRRHEERAKRLVERGLLPEEALALLFDNESEEGI
jgi:hypothetical protein